MTFAISRNKMIIKECHLRTMFTIYYHVEHRNEKCSISKVEPFFHILLISRKQIKKNELYPWNYRRSYLLKTPRVFFSLTISYLITMNVSNDENSVYHLDVVPS